MRGGSDVKCQFVWSQKCGEPVVLRAKGVWSKYSVDSQRCGEPVMLRAKEMESQ